MPRACVILSTTIPLTAAEEDRIRRKKAFEEAAKVRRIYEELVLKKPQETVVQIGTIQQIQMAVPGSGREAGSNFASAQSDGHLKGISATGATGPGKVELGPKREASVAGDLSSLCRRADPAFSGFSLGFGPGGWLFGRRSPSAAFLATWTQAAVSTSTSPNDRLSMRSSYNVPVARNEELAYANLRICL